MPIQGEDDLKKHRSVKDKVKIKEVNELTSNNRKQHKQTHLDFAINLSQGDTISTDTTLEQSGNCNREEETKQTTNMTKPGDNTSSADPATKELQIVEELQKVAEQ